MANNKLNFTNVIIGILLALIMTGCDDDFLDRYNKTSIAEDQFWQTTEQAIMGVNGIYRDLARGNVYGQYFYNDLYTPFAIQHAGNKRNGLEMGFATTRTGDFRGKWSECYRGIQNSNRALARLPEMSIKDDLKKRLIGESKFLRALFYFNLWDFYGGVPIYDAPVNYNDAVFPRNTSDEVIAFITKDLDDAIASLPVSYSSSDRGRATSGAAKALKGKIYLYSKKWDLAAQTFKEIIDSKVYNLHPVYAELFKYKTEQNSEVIFSIEAISNADYTGEISASEWMGNRSTYQSGFTWDDPSNILADLYENKDGSNFNWNNVIPGFSSMTLAQKDANVFKKEDETRKAWNNRDSRMAVSLILLWDEFVGKDNMKVKYKWPQSNSDATCLKINNPGPCINIWRKFVQEGNDQAVRFKSEINWPVIRYADVLLMYAEAKNEVSGIDATVFNAINLIRARAAQPLLQNTEALLPTFVASTDAMRQRVRRERAIEFAGEGIAYSDYRRWKIMIETCNHDVFDLRGSKLYTKIFEEKNYLWPIPQDEIEINPSLTQNPGWTN